MTNTYTRVLVCAGALTFGLASFAQAQAQQAPAAQQQPAQQPGQQPSAQQPAQQQASPPAASAQETVTSADVTDQELEQFAKSYEEVIAIQKDTEQQLASAADAAGAAKVKQEANQKMAQAVEGHGMKVERFNLIARSINQDTALKQRVQQKIQELRQPA
jgi:hypothetical protein